MTHACVIVVSFSLDFKGTAVNVIKLLKAVLAPKVFSLVDFELFHTLMIF